MFCRLQLCFTSNLGQKDMMQYSVAKNFARIKQKLDFSRAPKIMMAPFVAHDQLAIYMSLVALIIN